MEDLEAKLKDARESGCKKILIATDGVFSMDGYIANLKAICDLADRYDALTMVDDSHAVGFMGAHGRGTAEFCGVIGRVDIITGTFGKAMGGASGGYTAARQPIVDLLRQRSRPYLFSNTLAPAICAATRRTIDLLEESTALRDKVHENARYFRAEMEKLGFDLLPGVTDVVTLGRIYVEDMELLDVPDNVLPYFDFEAYGRDMRINEGGHFAPTGYLTRSGDFREVYHGIEDIPAEHRIFAYPKLNIREQMAAYKEVIDRSSLEGERLHPRKEHDDR